MEQVFRIRSQESTCCCSFWEKALQPLTSGSFPPPPPLRQTPPQPEHTVLVFSCRDIESFWLEVTSDPYSPAPLSAFESSPVLPSELGPLLTSAVTVAVGQVSIQR